MKTLVNKLITPTQPARYITIEEGTPEYTAAKGFLKWAGKDGTTHLFSDRGETNVFDAYIEKLKEIS